MLLLRNNTGPDFRHILRFFWILIFEFCQSEIQMFTYLCELLFVWQLFKHNVYNLIVSIRYIPAPCLTLGCEQICINNPPFGASCYCGDGYALQDDQKTCVGTLHVSWMDTPLIIKNTTFNLILNKERTKLKQY